MFSKTPSDITVEINYQNKLTCEFFLDSSLYENPKQLYENLCKEKQLFNYAKSKNLLFDEAWRYCLINKNSFDALLHQDTLIENADFGFITPKLTEEFRDTFNAGKSLIDEISFIDLLNKPEAIDKKILMQSLCLLCQLDAYNALELILKKTKTLAVDLSMLFSVALNCLNLATVQLLIKLDQRLLQMPLLCLQQSNSMVYIYTSPLLFTLYLPFNTNTIIGRLDPIVKPDHPKLIQIAMYLLAQGANPEQKTILSNDLILNFDTLKISNTVENDNPIEILLGNKKVTLLFNWDSRMLAHSYLDGKISNELSAEGHAFLKNLRDHEVESSPMITADEQFEVHEPTEYQHRF